MDQRLPQVDLPPGMIHLGLGQPSTRLLPSKEMEKAAAHSLKKKESLFLAYGEEQGNGSFRQVLADFLTAHYTALVRPDELFITNGNSQALDYICTRFTRPGDTILAEEPSYFLALKIFADRGLKVIPVPVDEHGLQTDVLENLLKTLNPAFLYTIPVFHNPAAVTLSRERREKLVRLSAENNLLIVADEVYQLLNYTEKLILPMGIYKDLCPLISLGSFSKILAPGLRLGWMEAGQRMMKALSGSGLLRSGGGLNPFVSEIVESVIRLDLLGPHIEKLKTVYQGRMEALCSTLETSWPREASFTVPGGGYFVWVGLPESVNTSGFRKEANAQNVDFYPGSFFSACGQLGNYLRLSFAFHESDDLIKGAEHLGQVIKAYLS